MKSISSAIRKCLLISLATFVVTGFSCSGRIDEVSKSLGAAVRTNESNLVFINVTQDPQGGSSEVFGAKVGDADDLELVLRAVASAVDRRHVVIVWDSSRPLERLESILNRYQPQFKGKGAKLTLYAGEEKPLIFHWLAPFDRPEDCAATLFFIDGKKLGTGTNGVSAALKQIESEKNRSIVIVGSSYSEDIASAEPPCPGLKESIVTASENSNSRIVSLRYFSASDIQ